MMKIKWLVLALCALFLLSGCSPAAQTVSVSGSQPEPVSETAQPTAAPTAAPTATAEPARKTEAPQTPEPTPEATAEPAAQTPVSVPEEWTLPQVDADADPMEKAQACIDLPVEALYALVGEPLMTEYAPSCFGQGEDGNLYYETFMVYTYRENGEEVVMSVE